MNSNKKIITKYLYCYNIPNNVKIPIGVEFDSSEKFINFVKAVEEHVRGLSVDGKITFEVTEELVDALYFGYKAEETDAEFHQRLNIENSQKEQNERELLRLAEKLGYEVRKKEL